LAQSRGSRVRRARTQLRKGLEARVERGYEGGVAKDEAGSGGVHVRHDPRTTRCVGVLETRNAVRTRPSLTHLVALRRSDLAAGSYSLRTIHSQDLDTFGVGVAITLD
jgi:hypothetical protein